MSESCALIEGVEGEFLDERDTVDLYVVALGSKLHVLHLLATDDGPHVWPVSVSTMTYCVVQINCLPLPRFLKEVTMKTAEERYE